MKQRLFLMIGMLILFTGITKLSAAQDCGPITSTELKQLLIGLGYEVKNINAEGTADKFEVKTTGGDLNIPISYEITPSTNYIWLTVFLGPAPADNSSANYALLKETYNVQPCQFYVSTRGNLMIGLALENRAVTPAVIKRSTESIINKVVSSKSVWQQK